MVCEHAGCWKAAPVIYEGDFASTWTHLALTLEGNVARLYVNGSLVATEPLSSKIANCHEDLRVRRHYLPSLVGSPVHRSFDAFYGLYSGFMSGIWFWDSTLSGTQVLLHRNETGPSIAS